MMQAKTIISNWKLLLLHSITLDFLPTAGLASILAFQKSCRNCTYLQDKKPYTLIKGMSQISLGFVA